ncbi:hypothetical protein [Spiroplasma sp. hyd1]|uniref:hypothetical protein n=1 Tax=Spiroplasma sp. hyd1 TaxID=1609976 RepID=UPI0018DD8799|nr:hypothetical protein [Spiroplasma sp. hyd1]MBH8623525.1 hypothetical protein [Spiroplasma sp. hyd1]
MSEKNNKKYDNLCKAGCIISLVFGGIIMLWLFIYSIICFISIGISVYFTGIGVFTLFCSLAQIFPILLCVNVLKEKAKSHTAAGIVSLIFTGIVGGVLILVGKYEKENKDKK